MSSVEAPWWSLGYPMVPQTHWAWTVKETDRKTAKQSEKERERERERVSERERESGRERDIHNIRDFGGVRVLIFIKLAM